jgi:hypothetical protein
MASSLSIAEGFFLLLILYHFGKADASFISLSFIGVFRIGSGKYHLIFWGYFLGVV